MDKYFFCDTYWNLFDIVCDLEDRQDNGEAIDESEMSKARSDFERHKRTCQECEREGTEWSEKLNVIIPAYIQLNGISLNQIGGRGLHVIVVETGFVKYADMEKEVFRVDVTNQNARQ